MFKGRWHVVVTVFGATVLLVVLTWALTLNHCKRDDCRRGNEVQAMSHETLSSEYSTSSDADWAQVWVGVIGLVGLSATTVIAALAWRQAMRANSLLAASLSAELEPLLRVDLEIPEGFKAKNGKLPALYFRIRNEGRSAAIVTRLFRSWHVLSHGGLPPPIKPPDTIPGWSKKQLSIPVGGGGESDTLRTLSENLVGSITSSDWIVFQGYIESRSLSGEEFQDGFCVLYSFKYPKMKRHLLLLDEDREEYNYHRRMPRKRPQFG